MANILQFPKRQFKIGDMKFLHKLYYIEENDTLWTSMQDTKTGKWGEWVMISERVPFRKEQMKQYTCIKCLHKGIPKQYWKGGNYMIWYSGCEQCAGGVFIQ